MTDQQEKMLIRAGIAQLQKACKGQRPTSIVWQIKDGRKRGRVRITCRRGGFVYTRWAELGAYPPRGLSMQWRIGEFLMRYEPVVVDRQEVEK